MHAAEMATGKNPDQQRDTEDPAERDGIRQVHSSGLVRKAMPKPVLIIHHRTGERNQWNYPSGQVLLTEFCGEHNWRQLERREWIPGLARQVSGLSSIRVYIRNRLAYLRHSRSEFHVPI